MREAQTNIWLIQQNPVLNPGKFTIPAASVYVWTFFRTDAHLYVTIWSVMYSVGACICIFSYRRFREMRVRCEKTACIRCEKCPRAKLKNCQIANCRKCVEEVFNHLCNYMKMRHLAYKKFGRKCCKKIKIMFVIQKFLLPLQPNNWGPLRPTSWYSIS